MDNRPSALGWRKQVRGRLLRPVFGGLSLKPCRRLCLEKKKLVEEAKAKQLAKQDLLVSPSKKENSHRSGRAQRHTHQDQAHTLPKDLFDTYLHRVITHRLSFKSPCVPQCRIIVSFFSFFFLPTCWRACRALTPLDTCFLIRLFYPVFLFFRTSEQFGKHYICL